MSTAAIMAAPTMNIRRATSRALMRNFYKLKL